MEDKREARKRVAHKCGAHKCGAHRSAGRPKGSIVVPKCYPLAKKLQLELRHKNYSIARWLDRVNIDDLLNYNKLSPSDRKDFDLCAKLIVKKTELPISMFFIEYDTRLSLLKKIMLKEESISRPNSPSGKMKGFQLFLLRVRKFFSKSWE